MHGVIQPVEHFQKLLFEGNEEGVLQPIPPFPSIAHVAETTFVDASKRIRIPFPKGTAEGIVHIPRQHAPLAVVGLTIKKMVLKHVIERANIIDGADVTEGEGNDHWSSEGHSQFDPAAKQ